MKSNPSEGFGFVVHDVARLMRWSFDRKSQDLGLTRAQWSVLASLHRQDGIQQKTLAQNMDITPISIARHLDHLEAAGWIERRADPDDRRAKRVYLTSKVEPMLKRLTELGTQVRDEAFAGIEPDIEELLVTTLRKIRNNLSSVDR